MPSPASPQHVYAREVQPSERSSLSVLADHIDNAARVLDLGCGTGALGRWLCGRGPCDVDGVTFNQAEADLASATYRRVVIGDLEALDLVAEFGNQQYDVIVCADVLEHLRSPERVLIQCRQLLRPGGRLLISVPNASYAGLVAELMHGQFRYRDEGLLDKTHLRFFTRASILAFMQEHDWQVSALDVVQRELHESEFRQPFDTLPPAVSRYLLTQPDALTYQFVLAACATPSSSETVPRSAYPIDTSHSDAEARFSIELMWDVGFGYSETRKLRTAGVIGRSRQQLTFDIQPGPTPFCGLRLDPADRPGFLHIFGLRLIDASGTRLWEWPVADDHEQGLFYGDGNSHQIHWIPLAYPSAAPLLLLSGNDPWFTLPINSDALQALAVRGGSLEVTLGWPMSADYLHASQAMHAMEQRLAAEAQRAETARHEVQQMQAAAHDLHHRQQVAEHERLQWQDRARSALDEKARAMQERQALEHALLSTQRQIDQLRNHLQWIENSTVFRATRPLVRMKMAWTRLMTPPPPPQHTPAAVAAADPRLPHLAQPVDVIVPVYKGLFDTQRCIRSALASQCQTPWRLVVINDASPEPDVTAWLREMAASESRMLLLENPENLGFVGTVNRGMALSTGADVLLLNSDTEVANDWLDRLCRAAHAHPRNGTVTPFSNNATICSYPRFCEPNALIDGHTTASLDALAASNNAGMTVEVPTGIGFCMYIRRDCLDAVGLFDVPNFGKGYGEENDFCQRALALGWRNLHALDTFVLHAGGVSFGASKSQRELDAMETLRRLHPGYEASVMRFIAEDPAKPYRRALDLARLRASSLRKVLCVVHDRAGGTLRHVQELAGALTGSAHLLTLTPVPGQRVLLKFADPREEMALEFQVHEQWNDLVALLTAIGVTLVHFHHWLGHDPLVRQLPEQLGVPFDFTAHDHYSYCPQISLTDYRNRYCGEEGLAQCTTCLARSPAPGGVDIVTWRDTNQAFLRKARHILAPSADMAQRMDRFVPGCDVRLAPHLDLHAATLPPVRPPAPRPTHAPLRVVVIGALSTIKGADLLEDVAVAAARSGVPVEFHLLGYGYRSLKTQPRARLTVHGEYAETDLPGLLEWLKPDIAWFPAQWPETYSYTLSACLAAGLPVVAPDLGAFPERLAGREWSWVCPWNQSPQAWLELFIAIHRDHVVLGVSPAPCADSSTRWRPTMPDWVYGDAYLGNSPHATSAAPRPIGDAGWVSRFLPGMHRTPVENASLGARRLALHGLLRLRSAPGLRTLSRAVPLRWQTRLKSWLIR
ncbi:methyltransferase domain-containing protein [Paracidovorax sp. MALMAid1276]|uniref:methyltransferase domain-containing protein n=1 Tax=Paracidovorax sp. MALMAid1276 TaxID=3411631 RepID=UPI003B992C3D